MKHFILLFCAFTLLNCTSESNNIEIAGVWVEDSLFGIGVKDTTTGLIIIKPTNSTFTFKNNGEYTVTEKIYSGVSGFRSNPNVDGTYVVNPDSIITFTFKAWNDQNATHEWKILSITESKMKVDIHNGKGIIREYKKTE